MTIPSRAHRLEIDPDAAACTLTVGGAACGEPPAYRVVTSSGHRTVVCTGCAAHMRACWLCSKLLGSLATLKVP